MQVNSQDVLATGLLITLHHEMSISASTAPLPFNAFGMGSCANDGVTTAVRSGIFDSPDMAAGALHPAMHGATRTLANFPGIELLAAHEARTLGGPH